MGHDRAPDTTILLKLYVTGATLSAQRAEGALSELVNNYTNEDIRVEIVDVLSNPEIALADGVFATPTVIRSGKGVDRRLVGDLSSVEKLQIGLLVDLAP